MNDLSKKKAGSRLLFTNIAYWMTDGCYTPFLSSYYRSIGLSSREIGILLAIGPACAICIQPVWAMFSDRSGKRKKVLELVTVGAAIASLMYYGGKSFTYLFFATVCMAVFYYALLPLCDAIVIESARRFGCDFARIRMGGTLGYAFVVFMIGFFLERVPAAQFALLFLMLLLFLTAQRHIPKEETEEGQSWERRAVSKKKGGRIFQSREILFVLAFVFVGQAGLAFSGTFLGVYVLELGYSQSLVGILSCISALSEIPILFCASKLMKRFSAMQMLAFSSLMMAVRIFLTGLGVVPTMVIAQLMQSVTYMIMYFCVTTYISEHVCEGKASQGQSILSVVQMGLAAVTANIAGGFVGERLSTQIAFYTASVVVLVGAILVIVVYRLYVHGRIKKV